MAPGTTDQGGAQAASLATALEQVPAAIATLRGPDHVIERANERYLALAGRDASVIGKRMRDAIPESVEQGFIELLDGVYRSGDSFRGSEVEVQIAGAAGATASAAIVDILFLAMRGVDGEVDGIMVHVLDVSTVVAERLRMVELARDLEAQRSAMETIVEQVPVAIVVADVDGTLTLVNQMWRDLFNASHEVLADPDARDRLHVEHPDGTPCPPEQTPLRRALRDGERVVGESLRLVDDHGGLRLIEVSAAPVRDPDGRIISGVGAIVDATERVALEHELAGRRAATQTQALMNDVFDAAGDGIWVLDDQGRTALLNPAAQRMTGWEPEDIIGEISHFKIHHSHEDGSPYPIEECPIYRSVFFGEPCQVEDEVFWRKDGSSFPVSYRSTPIFTDGRQAGAVQVFRDLTKERLVSIERDRARDAAVAERRAFEINDTIVQRLAVADLAYGLGRTEQAAEAVHEALEMSKQIISDWAGDGGSLTRSAPACTRRADDA